MAKLSKKRIALLVSVSALALLALLFFASTEWGENFGADAEGERLERMKKSPHFADGVFKNSRPAEELKENIDATVIADFFKGNPKREAQFVPMRQDTKETLAKPPASGLRLTWLGHSTMIVEIDGLRFLTDPMWGPRASPTSLGGPKRFHKPPLPIEDLGPLDGVLVSHDHFDHFDMNSVKALGKTGVPFFAPLGVGAHLERWGIPKAQIHEFDWWEETTLPKGVRLVATPAQHFSGRTGLDRNSTLWCSWSVIGPSHRVFYSGDSGLEPAYPEIGEKLGPFDVAAIEIGASHPAWGAIHLGPKNALIALAQVKGRALLPVHWGTFNLALHDWSEPAETLFTEATVQNVKLLSPMLGQAFEPELEQPNTPWWREAR